MLKVSHATALINNTQTNTQPRNINNTKKEKEKKKPKAGSSTINSIQIYRSKISCDQETSTAVIKFPAE